MGFLSGAHRPKNPLIGFFLISFSFQICLLGRGDEIHQVVKSAFARSWEIENADFIKKNAQDDYHNKVAGFFPAVSFVSTHGFQGGDLAPSSKISTYTLQAKASIFSFPQLDDLKSARLYQNVEELRFSEKQNKFCLDVANLYLDLLTARKRLETSENILQILRRQFGTISAEFRQGLRPRSDFLRLRAELRSSELQELNQRIAISDVTNHLRDKLGADLNQFSFQPNQLNPPSLAVKPATINNSVKLLSLNKELEFHKQLRKGTEHLAWPQVSLIGTYGYSDADYWNGRDFQPNAHLLWTLGLGIQYTFWDWGIERRTRDISRRLDLVRENEIYQEIRAAQNDASLANEKVQLAQEAFVSQKLLLTDQKDSFKIISRDFREGRIKFLDYISTLQALASAELSTFESLVELNRSYFLKLLHEDKLNEYFNVR